MSFPLDLGIRTKNTVSLQHDALGTVSVPLDWDIQYADYWERNLYNGILAQQHPDTGMVAYFLPLNPVQ